MGKIRPAAGSEKRREMSHRVTLVVIWSAYVVGWLVFAILEVSAFCLTQGMSLRTAFAAAANITLPAFILGSLIWKITGWVTWDRSWVRFAAIQLVLSLTYSGLWTAAIMGELVFSLGKVSAWLTVKTFLWWQIEFGVIAYAIIASGFYVVRTFFRLRAEEQRRQQAEMLRVRAELEALKGKLQPHFLFNTLHTVTALVRTDPVKAEGALLKLGEVLRYVLRMKRDDADDDVPLAEEWAFVEQYLDIEQIRLGSRLRIKTDLSFEAKECAVPMFTLQPLVENAIHHAISPRAKGGEVRVAASVRGNRLELEVADDGPGAELALVEQSPGFGLRTVRQRLETRFRGDATFRVRTALGGGFVVNLSLPLDLPA